MDRKNRHDFEKSRFMRILHLITTIDRGGAEKQLLTLVKEQVKNGDLVSVYYLKGKGELRSEFESLSVEVRGERNTFHSLGRIFRALGDSRKFDLIHAHLPAAELVGSFLHRSLPLVVSRHNTQRFLEKHKIISLFMSRVVESQSNACIAISNSVREYLLNTSEWKDASSLSIVPYAIEKSHFYLNRKRDTSENCHFLFIGRLTKQKDVETLLKAFAIHIRSFYRDSLTIVGDGELKFELQAMSKQLKIEDRITWVGRVDEVDSFFQSHDVFVLPSKYEGFGLVLLECMVNDRPIIAANNSAIPEVIGQNHPGLFKTGDVSELASLMARSRREDFSNLALSIQRSRVDLFHSSRMAKQIRDVYKKALD